MRVDSSHEARVAWHERRRQELEGVKSWATGLWHLDRRIALEPESAQHHVDRARAHLAAGMSEGALEDLSRLLALEPENVQAWHVKGHAHGSLGNWQDAVADYSKAIALAPHDPHLWTDRGDALASLSRWSEAAADHRRAIDLGNDWPLSWRRHAILRLVEGRREEYKAVCGALVERFGGSENPGWLRMVPWACSLVPGTVEDCAPLVETAQKLVAGIPRNYACLLTLAAALHRAGRHAEALQRLEEARGADEDGGTAYDRIFQALAAHSLGKASEAKEWLEKGKAWLEEDRVKGERAAFGLFNRLELRILLEEAEALILAEGPTQRVK